ncbi:MAG: hypothetical protein DRG36_04815 [Deltaproteobacteria bacterium]|nr:MAG: hypothetical protein DRG36_04815 [Deltaproteobacteria bacterium]
MEERRRRTRVPFQGEAEFNVEGAERLKVNVRDLSLSGVYLFSQRKFPVGASCRVKLKLIEGSDKLFLELRGRIVRTDEEGMGIKFEEMTPLSFYHLKRLIEHNMEDPERVEMELVAGGWS